MKSKKEAIKLSVIRALRISVSAIIASITALAFIELLDYGIHYSVGSMVLGLFVFIAYLEYGSHREW